MVRRLFFVGLFLLTMVLIPADPVLAASGIPSQTTTLPTQRRISEVKELPTTGIPILAWALVGLIPVGKKMISFGREKSSNDSVIGIKEAREFRM